MDLIITDEICVKLFNQLFYKIFNAAQNKYFSPKSILLRIFLYLCSKSEQFASALNIQSWED